MDRKILPRLSRNRLESSSFFDLVSSLDCFDLSEVDATSVVEFEVAVVENRFKLDCGVYGRWPIGTVGEYNIFMLEELQLCILFRNKLQHCR